jgi:Flp pilus assembly pilin Flp
MMGKQRTEISRFGGQTLARGGLRVCRALTRFWSDPAGATAVEYAVMLALILGVILIAVTLVGTNTKQLWTTNQTSLQGVGFGS